MGLNEWFENSLRLDYMGTPIQLNVEGKKSIRTMLGVCMTIGYLLAVSVFSYIIFVSYLATNEPSIAQEWSEEDTIPVFDMYKEDLLPVVYVL